MHKKILLILSFMVVASYINAQEIQARLTVMANKIGSQVNKNVFQNLQSGLTNFLNNRKWTNDVFQTNEKIQCNFLLSIEEALPNNVFRAKLTIQAARPVYSTTYDSPIINFMDDDVVFRFQEFQSIEFN